MLLKAQLPELQIEYVLQEMSEVYDWGLIDLNIPEVHKQTLGEGIKVAIVDSGQSEHFEVVPNTVKGKNFTKSPTVYDKRGHSTAVAGIIAAAKNDQGVIGVAPKSQLYFAKAIDDSGTGSPSALTNAVNWAVDEKVDIISISAGMFFDFKPLKEAIIRAYSSNITVVAACGNTGSQYFDVAFPARYPEVIGVAAYDQNRRVASFSSRGVNVFCAMPGVDIYSTYLDNGYVKLNGTSLSCPIMTGVCALILSKHRKNNETLSPRQLMDNLRKYAKKLQDDPKAVGFGTIDTDALFRE